MTLKIEDLDLRGKKPEDLLLTNILPLDKLRCAECGCSSLAPCPTGCYWVRKKPTPLCSACAQGTRPVVPGGSPAPAEHGVQLFDCMTAEQTAFRHRGELGIYYGGAGGAIVMARDVHYGDDGVPRVQGGYPLTLEQLSQMMLGIQGGAPTRVVLPANVIMWDGLGKRVAWWVESGRRRIWFSPKRRPEMRHVSRNRVMHPPLLLIADPGHLQVYALAENQRPTANTQLFQAPYPNVYDTGGVCAGGVAWPRTLDLERLADWEQAWFDSEGTFPTAPRLTLYPGGHCALWEAMLTAEEFPSESLVPLGITVLDAINHDERPRTLPFVTEEIVPAVPALEGVA